MKPKSKEQFSVTLDKDLVKLLEETRGDVPRSTYINRILWKGVKENEPTPRI